MAFTSMCRMMIAVSAVVLHLWPGDARAQEYEASNLTLKKSYIKSDFDVLPLHAGSAALFTPTTVSCPGAGTCLIRVEITEQILGLDSEAELRNCIRVDGSFSGVFPNGCVRHNYVATLQNKTLTLTLAWVVPVTAGTHQIEVRTAVVDDIDGSMATVRLLTIQVLKQ